MDEVLESLLDEQKNSTAKRSDEMAFSNSKTDDERNDRISYQIDPK